MNIIVQTPEKKIIVRPDTTWERDNEDVFLPEFVNSVSWSPVLFARVSKPGRSVGRKFADRYYDAIGYGVLLYPDDLIDGTGAGFASACCLDHTSFLPTPLYDKLTLGREGNVLELKADGTELFSFNSGTAAMIEEAICEATRFCYIRVGDLIAIELQERKPLCSRTDAKCHVSGTYCGNFLTDFTILF